MKVMLWRDCGNLSNIKRAIKAVNIMNRVLLQDQEDFSLQSSLKKPTCDFEVMCDIYEPKVVEVVKELEVIKEVDTAKSSSAPGTTETENSKE